MRQNFEFLSIAHEIIIPDYFSSNVLAWFFKTIRDHYIDYQVPVSGIVLKNELLKAIRAKHFKKDEVESYAKCFCEIEKPVTDSDYIANEVTKFCRHQAIKAAIFELPPLLVKGDFDAVESVLKDALETGTQLNNLGVQYFMDWPNRLRKRETRFGIRPLPTGIFLLDDYIGGGLRPKQLGIWMGPPNRGKSLALLHCAKRTIISKKRVIYYTLELSEEDVSERFDSSFSKIPVKELMDREDVLVERLEGCGIVWGNSLIIKEYSACKATTNTLRSHILQCKQQGFDPDMVIIDYLDLLRPIRQRREKRDELSDITTDLRNLSKEFLMPVWTATQSNRSAIALETHTEEQVSEDIGKVAIADVVITINQTTKEVAEKKMRLFLAKNRNGPKYITIPIQGDTYRMCFYDPELS